MFSNFLNSIFKFKSSNLEEPIDNETHVENQGMEPDRKGLNEAETVIEKNMTGDQEQIQVPGEHEFEESFTQQRKDFDDNNDDDNFPLIKGPYAQGTLHQILQTIKWVSTSFGNLCQRPHRVQEAQVTPSQNIDHQNDDGVLPSKCSMGIILGSLSCIFFATSALIVKISTLHPMELLCFRGLVQGLLISPIIVLTGNNYSGPRGFRALLFARGTLGSVALILAFISIHLIELGDAATVIFTSPVFVSLFGCFCLGEMCTIFDTLTIALTLIGVLLVSKPSFLSGASATGKVVDNGNDPLTTIIGTLCGLLAAILNASAFIILRQLKTVHYSVVVFWFSFILCFFGGVLTIALDAWSAPWDSWVHLVEGVGIGVCGFFGQILLTKALQIETASSIAVTRTLDIVLSFMYQISLLGESPDLWSIIGSGLVVSCVLLTATKKWYYNYISTIRNGNHVFGSGLQFCIPIGGTYDGDLEGIVENTSSNRKDITDESA